MREIEVKAKVGSAASVIEKLEQAGVQVSEPVHQRDEVFGLPGDDGFGVNTQPWLRIRTETKKSETRYLFTLKKSITNQLDSIEHETEISDPNELRQIILHSGFEPYSDITKSRRKVQIGEIEMCIDVVDKLGEFVEAEKLTEEAVDYEAVVEELWQVLKPYGVKRESQVTQGYDTLIKSREHEAAKT